MLLQMALFHSSLWLTDIPLYLFTYFNNVFIFGRIGGLRCCTRAFSSCSERGLLFVVVHGLLIAVASLVAEHGL